MVITAGEGGGGGGEGGKTHQVTMEKLVPTRALDPSQEPEYGQEAGQDGSPLATVGRELLGRREYRTLVAP